MEAVPLILGFVVLYVFLGVIALLFVTIGGLGRVDHTAEGSTWGYKVLVFPGLVAFWPLVLSRWIRGAGSPPPERSSHRTIANAASGTSKP